MPSVDGKSSNKNIFLSRPSPSRLHPIHICRAIRYTQVSSIMSIARHHGRGVVGNSGWGWPVMSGCCCMVAWQKRPRVGCSASIELEEKSGPPSALNLNSELVGQRGDRGVKCSELKITGWSQIEWQQPIMAQSELKRRGGAMFCCNDRAWQTSSIKKRSVLLL